jgi:hypothetical protein
MSWNLLRSAAEQAAKTTHASTPPLLAPTASGGGAAEAELPHELLHLLAGLEQTVDVRDLRAAAGRDPPPA